MELFTKLGIDLKLLLAQIVNFSILLAVLTWLVYKPILAVLDKRKKMIEKNVADAQKMEERLQKLEEDREKILDKAAKEAMETMEKAKKEAEEQHGLALAKAKLEISALAERYRAGLKDEKEAMVHEIKSELADLIVKSSGKVIQKEFSKDDQKRLEKAISEELKSAK